MADTDYMINITQCEFKKLVRQYAGCICKAEKRVIREDSSQSHSSCVENSLMAEAT